MKSEHKSHFPTILLCSLQVMHESSDTKLLYTKPLCYEDMGGLVRKCTPVPCRFTNRIFIIHASANKLALQGDNAPPPALWDSHTAGWLGSNRKHRPPGCPEPAVCCLAPDHSCRLICVLS